MKTVMSTEEIELPYHDYELIEGKWLNLLLVSKKISKFELDNKIVGKSYRSKFHNSAKGNKYHIEIKAGLKCIDVTNPMSTAVASLIVSFKKVNYAE